MPGLTWLRGKNHRINKRFVRTKEHGRRQSAKAENNAESQNDIPNMLEVLDKVLTIQIELVVLEEQINSGLEVT